MEVQLLCGSEALDLRKGFKLEKQGFNLAGVTNIDLDVHQVPLKSSFDMEVQLLCRSEALDLRKGFK